MNHDESIVLTNVRVIDGTGADARDNQTIIVKDGIIEWIGPSAEARQVDDSITVLNLVGQTVMPGFMDCHVHLASGEDLNPAFTLHEPPTMGPYRAVRHMRRTLDAGVTTVRDLSGVDYSAVLAVEQGIVAGPRMVVAIKALSPTGGHGDARTMSVPMGEVPSGSMLVDSPAEARRHTRELMRSGAGVIKIMGTGGVWSPRSSPEHVGMTVEEIRAVVETAESRGIKVASHAQGAQGIKNALNGGVKSIEHGYLIDDEGIQLMLDKDAWLVPTLSTGTTPPPPTSTFYQAEKKNRVRGQLQENIAKAFAAGVKVALGTDVGVIPHGTNLRELGLMVNLGLSPMQAIVAGTSEAAKLIGVDDLVGTLEAGMAADMVVTDVDPLKNIGALSENDQIKIVIQSGRVIKLIPTISLV